MIQGSSVGYSSFPRKREARAPKSQRLPLFRPEPAPGESRGAGSGPRFRGGDDTLLITLASFQVRHLGLDVPDACKKINSATSARGVGRVRSVASVDPFSVSGYL